MMSTGKNTISLSIYRIECYVSVVIGNKITLILLSKTGNKRKPRPITRALRLTKDDRIEYHPGLIIKTGNLIGKLEVTKEWITSYVDRIFQDFDFIKDQVHEKLGL